jgi:hypothetical protein
MGHDMGASSDKESRTTLQALCRLVEIMIMEVFAKHDRWLSNRLSS